MHTVNINMTKAAKDRLSLLNADMPIPLDPQTISPFSFRFSNQKILCITYEGADVAYVPKHMNEDKKSFSLFVVTAENPTVDMALQRAFIALTNHLNVVGKVLSAESKRKKTLDEEKWEKALNEENEMNTEYVQRIEAAALNTELDPKPLTMRTLKTAALAQADEDLLTITATHLQDRYGLRLRQRYIHLFADITVSETTGATITLRDAPRVPALTEQQNEMFMSFLNGPAVIREVNRIAERNLEALEPETLLNDLKSLPETLYSSELLALQPLPVPIEFGTPLIHERRISEEVSLVAYQSKMGIKNKGVIVATMRFGRLDEENFETHEFFADIYGPLKDVLETMSEREIRNLAEQWLSMISEARPDVDLSAYRKPDMNSLIREAEIADAGYGF